MIQGKVVTTYEIDAGQLAEMQELLAAFPRRAAQVTAAALNDAGRRGKRLVLKSLSTELGIRQRDLDRDRPGAHWFGGVQLQRADRESLEARIEIVSGQRRGRIPLALFHARSLGPVTVLVRRKGYRVFVRRQRTGGVSYKIGAAGRKTIREVFLAQFRGKHGRGHHLAVVQRRGAAASGKKGGKLLELFGPSIPHVAIKSPEIQEAIETELVPRMIERIRARLGWLKEEVTESAE